MTNYLEIDALIQGIINADNAAKQDLGRRFAAYLGLTPGPPGPDGGIDGQGTIKGQHIYFQSKLFRIPLAPAYAAEFCGYLGIYKAEIGVMLAGVGYAPSFEPLLKKCPNIDRIKIHLLTLEDIFAQTPNFEAAVKNLPPLRDLGGGRWEAFR